MIIKNWLHPFGLFKTKSIFKKKLGITLDFLGRWRDFGRWGPDIVLQPEQLKSELCVQNVQNITSAVKTEQHLSQNKCLI